MFPMLMQRNGIAKIFGEVTTGAGGNVDDGIATLSNSQATLNLTRGLYTTFRADGAYTDADLVENNGITPDYHYSHTVADFRAGFVGYIKAFSDKAVAP
jgi:C-terminal processing protease CtpA/Prc